MWLGMWSVATIRIGFWTWIWSTRHWTGAGSGLLISMLENFNQFLLTGLITLLLLMWKWMVLNEEKSSFKILGLTFSFKLDWGSYIISIAKSACKKLVLLFVLWSFFFLRLLYISINLTYGHASSYLELLDKLQKWICRTIGPSLTASLKSLTHRQNVAILSLVYSIEESKITCT